MDKNEAKLKIEALRSELAENNRRYYVDNAPVISDYEFDRKMHELEHLEAQFPEFDSPDSPTRRVGSDIDEPVDRNAGTETGQGFVKRPHRYPMLSLGNTYSISEVEEFSARADKILGHGGFTYCCELKFDGTAICLTYRNGLLFRALTRGDGVQGDDVTENVRRISNIPERLSGSGWPDDLEIRGEILMPYAAFEALNKEREDIGEAPFANPRNAASGSLKLSDPEEVGRRGLWCTLYHIPAQSVEFRTHDDALRSAASWGLPVSDLREVCHNIDEIKAFIEKWDTGRKTLPYATDGCVVKINELAHQRELGYTAKSPRWAVAYKFKAEQALTPILGIDYQVGRTGAITPVANLSPVLLSGTVVKRATLNNEDQMRLLDIRIGDYVYLEKGGEIIPKITGVELSMRRPDAVTPEFPDKCPDCGAPLQRAEGEAKSFCPNSDACPMQIKGRLLHFAGRKAMDILAGENTVEQFYDLGLVHTPADLYDLKKSQLVHLEGWKDRAAERFLQSLDDSLSVPFERVLFALGIRYVGETTAKALARSFGTIDAIISATKEELLAIPDIGDVVAGSVYSFLREPKHIGEIERLRRAGLKFEVMGSARHSNALEGKTIVISGTFGISRDEMKELIEKHGGKPSGSVSRSTAFLLAGAKPGPEKIAKCEALGVKIVGEAEFFAMLPSDAADHVRKTEIVEELTLF